MTCLSLGSPLKHVLGQWATATTAAIASLSNSIQNPLAIIRSVLTISIHYSLT